jgi:hypothetical protein
MSRLPGWDIRLTEAIDAEVKKPFSFENKADCGWLMGASVRACLGDDHPVLHYLERYATEAYCRVMLAEEGGLQGILSKFFPEVHPSLAQDGDIGYFGEGPTAAGLVCMGGVAVGKAPKNGVFYIPMKLTTKVFKV